AAVEPEQAAAAAAETEMPDWLRDLRGSAASQEPVSEPPAAASAETEVPDWLRDVDSSPADSTATPAPAAAPWSMPSVVPVEEPAEALPPAEPATELPDWLSTLQPAAKIEPAITPIEPAKPAGEFEPAMRAAKPGSRAQIKPAIELPAESREEPEAAADMPDWLQALRNEAPAAAVSNLAQGDIPDWLQALRPADEGLSEFEEESHEAEPEGVLAGIAHTLPAVPLISEVHGLPTNLKVETSAQDLAHASMLQELLAGGAAAPKPAMIVPGANAGARLRRRVGQVVVAAVILLAVSVPAWVNLNQALGINLLPRVETLPSDSLLRSASNTIDQLPEGASALVIFDYDPTQAGEMNPIADVMVRHLIRQGVNIKTASLNPLGSSLARGVWLRAGGLITDSASFKDLGYVAGQSIGVQQLLANNSSSKVVIDLAASSDSVRWWVEQITTLNSPAPLVVGLSASAAPLVLPYIRSGQVKGMVTGMVGALIYAQHAGLAPLSNTDQLTEQQIHLEAQTLAQWVMALIILIGMLSALFSRGGRRSTV
ncbi:MAG TPA: hypothetical protein VFK30_00085, partial [Anaerolineae bacterium]|nr:hypothetical protein [Anaerolineae bacterium]